MIFWLGIPASVLAWAWMIREWFKGGWLLGDKPVSRPKLRSSDDLADAA